MTATSAHFPKPVSTDQTIKPDSVLTNPTGKNGGEAGRCKHLPHKLLLL